jgi:hypothetical protein
VTPTNRAGAGPATRMVATTKALCAPRGAPGLVTSPSPRALDASGKVQVTWGPPANGACVSHYLVYTKGQSQKRDDWIKVVPETPEKGASAT